MVSAPYIPRLSRCLNSCLGAAGNFLAPISGLSENAFRTVIEIDTVNSEKFALGSLKLRVTSDWNL